MQLPKALVLTCATFLVNASFPQESTHTLSANGTTAGNTWTSENTALATREVDITLINLSSRDLNLRVGGIDVREGRIKPDAYPPPQIPRGGQAAFGFESIGPMAGTEAYIQYTFGWNDFPTQVGIWFQNPYIGSKKYAADLKGPEREKFLAGYTGNDEDHAEMIVFVEDRG